MAETVDPWSTVVPAEELVDYNKFKGMVTGGSGAGKTELGAKMAEGDRVLIGCTEQQAIMTIQAVNPRAQIKQIRTLAELNQFRAMTRDPSLKDRVDAVVLDSLTDTQRLFRDFYMEQQKNNRQKDDAKKNAQADMKTWGLIVDATARLAREMRDLPVHTMVICLDAEENIEGEGVVHRPMVMGKKLPNDLAQYFNVVGFIFKRMTERGLRREVMFQGPDRFLTKGTRKLNAIEPPEPLSWISKQFGTPVPDDVAARVGEWLAMSAPPAEQKTAAKPVAKTPPEQHDGTVDPFTSQQ